jgi:RimJ/RimL family protein N-acetyltransferase
VLEHAHRPPTLPDGYTVSVWRPRDAFVPPTPIRSPVNRVWALFDRAGVFANDDFAVLQLRHHGQLVQRTSVFPRYFRFPFMAREDLQLGDTWTAPEARGRGLATLAIDVALARFGYAGRRFWYLVEESNTPSIRVIEKHRFTLAGTGVRRSRLGVAALGYFTIVRPA